MPRKPKPRQCKTCKEDFIYTNYRRVYCLNCSRDSEYYKNLSLGEYRNRYSVKHKHPSWANSHIRLFCRNWNKELRRLPCQVCGYKLHVELAHIKPISEFEDTTKLQVVNSSENLLALCRNHHWEFDHGVLKLNDIPARIENKTTHKVIEYIPIKECNKRVMPKSKKNCEICGMPCSYTSRKCLKCSSNQPRLDKRRVERPSKDELEKLIWEVPTTILSTRFGVSDKAIEKWCKSYQIAKPPRGYWNKLNASKQGCQKTA